MADNIRYDEIEMDPLEIIFNKLHKARGGEMILVHISEFGKDGPFVRFCSAINKKESIMTNLLPLLIENFLNEQDNTN